MILHEQSYWVATSTTVHSSWTNQRRPFESCYSIVNKKYMYIHVYKTGVTYITQLLAIKKFNFFNILNSFQYKIVFCLLLCQCLSILSQSMDRFCLSISCRVLFFL